MAEERYTVSQVEKLTGIKGHVLRYWEDELELVIGRNAMGHRSYTGYDVQMFLNIKELKSRGMQLKGIKELLPRISRKGPGASGGRIKLLEAGEGAAVTEEEAPREISEETLYARRMEQFQRILERLIAEELKQKNHEERRCRSLDEAIRLHQQTRKQVAAAKEKPKKTARLWRKQSRTPVGAAKGR